MTGGFAGARAGASRETMTAGRNVAPQAGHRIAAGVTIGLPIAAGLHVATGGPAFAVAGPVTVGAAFYGIGTRAGRPGPMKRPRGP